MAASKLRSLPGVMEVRISLVTHSSEITFDPIVVTEERILNTLNSLGFPSSVKNSRVIGDSTKCVTLTTLCFLIPVVLTEKEQAQVQESLLRAGAAACNTRLERNPGKKSAAASMPRAITHFSVDYDSNKVGARALLRLLSECVPGVTPALAPLGSTAPPANPTLRSYRLRLMMSLLLAIPVLLFSFIFPWLGESVNRPFARELVSGFPVRTLLAWILSTPIQFGAGWPLYVSGYRALRYGRTANIDVLVMLSTTVAYVYSVIAAFAAFADHPFTGMSVSLSSDPFAST